jgi:cupin fold WbuC family metalloprotein
MYSGRMKLLSQSALDELAARAATSPRKRAHLNLHESPSDLLQRFFVAADRDTYIRPHRHRVKSELALVVRGRFDILTFDDAGTVTGRWMVGEGSDSLGYEATLMTWHTVVSRVDGAVFLEVKEGPYDPAVAAEFAPWAPAEGDASAAACREWMRSAQAGDRFRGPVG